MKTMIHRLFDGFDIVLGFSEAYLNPEASKKEGRIVYFENESERIIDDEAYQYLYDKFMNLGEREQLTTSGKVIQDNRGIVFWMNDGKYRKTEITKLGQAVPKGGILQNDLSVDQVAEINDQLNIERISSLSADEKSKEKEYVLSGILREAALKGTESQITGVAFDAKKWYADQKAIIDQRYA